MKHIPKGAPVRLLLFRKDLFFNHRSTPLDQVSKLHVHLSRRDLELASQVEFIDRDGSSIMLKDRFDYVGAKPPTSIYIITRPDSFAFFRVLSGRF